MSFGMTRPDDFWTDREWKRQLDWQEEATKKVRDMGRTLGTQIPPEAQQAAEIARELFGPHLAGVYLYGSAVDGGLRDRSDVDVLVVLEQELTDDTRQALLAKIMAVSGPLGNAHGIRPLEVTVLNRIHLTPWRHPPRQELQYGEWLRAHIEKGWLPPAQEHADLTILLYQVREKSVALLGPIASELLPRIPLADVKKAIGESLTELAGFLVGDERNVILTLARMWQTVTVGIINPKDVAADWAVSRLPKEYRGWMEMAAQAYRGECRDEWTHLDEELKGLVDYLVQAIAAGIKHSMES